MTKQGIKNTSASVRQRLLNLSKERGEEFQSVLTRFALERLLYRLSQSPHKNTLVLKGAFLFVVWGEQIDRPTKDLDFLAFGDPGVERFEAIVKELCEIDFPSDGLEFKTDTVRGAPIREAALYDGIRIHLIAMLGTARIPLQIDIGFGDAIEPPPTEITYPTMLDFPRPTIRGYRRELAIAEKFEAMVSRGAVTSRLKDYYDIWILSSTFEFDREEIASAVAATFQRRGTILPSGTPSSLGEEFISSPDRIRQWDGLMKRFRPQDSNPTLAEAASAVRIFLLPVVDSIRENLDLTSSWPPGGPWQPERLVGH